MKKPAEETTLAEDTALPLSGPILLNGLPTRAPLIVTLNGEHAGLWLVDLAGEPCGAWVLPAATREAARKILSICDRRALIAFDPAATIDALLTVSKTAEVDIARATLETRLCSIPRLLTDTAEARSAHLDALRAVSSDEEQAGPTHLGPSDT